jgi:hypothetical protein
MPTTKKLPEVNLGKHNAKIKVSSSFIEAIGYEPHIGAIAIWFLNGSHAAYIGCSQTEFDLFLNAQSKGSYYSKHIKGKKTSTIATKT